MIALSLCGCSSLAPPATLATATSQTGLAVVTQHLSGRISLHYTDLVSGHEESLFGRFDWSRHDDAVDLALLNPLGQSSALIHFDADHSTLTTADGKTFEDHDVEALTSRMLGWYLPLYGLIDWLDGQPAEQPAPDEVLRDAADHVTHIRQDGWTIDYPADSNPGGKPRRIDLAFANAQVSAQLRLVIDGRE